MNIKNIFDIKNIFYINLNERIDRKNHIEEQLSKLNLKGNIGGIYNKKIIGI